MGNDHQLVENFLSERSEASFRTLYRSKTPELYALALRMLAQDDQAAQDILQETWIVAIEKLTEFQWRSSLKTWLTGILINLCKEKFRKKRKTSHIRGNPS